VRRHGPVASTLRHDALLYRDLDELASHTRAFVEGGLAAGEPVMLAMPAPHIQVMRAALGPAADEVRFADMTQVGRNPARIIPFVSEWLADQGGGPARFVGEPIWPERRPSEAIEGERHEALLNVAFAHAPVHILCPYDAAHLDDDVLAGSYCTHPTMVVDGATCASHEYGDPLEVYAAGRHPLPDPPADADALAVTHDLGRMRRFIRDHARDAELDPERLADLLIAANEAVTNTLVHGGDGIVRVWRDSASFICEIADGGRIADPLVGRRMPDRQSPNGRGLWLINQLCDLVELRSQDDGTIVRLHTSLT
jgi:anti-sigma regulatory factor (Ser/Thr protein kinase)